MGLIYALLALGGAFADPSVPRTLGLAVFSLVHGGAASASVPPTPSLLGIGGSLRLGLPATSFALLPFLAALLMGRAVARRAGSTVLFAAAVGLAYAIVVGVLAAFSASTQDAGGGVAARFAADPLSGAWRAFLWAGLGALLGATAARGPLLLPSRAHQVLRGAFAAVGVSLALTVLLAVALLVAQVLGSPAQQGAPEAPASPTPDGPAAGGGLPAAIGVLFALLPAVVGQLWLLAHGLPVGLQGAPDLGGLPLVGPALADLPLRVTLLGNWPPWDAWRLLLLGPAVGLVAGGALAARGAPAGERWWQGALIAVPYAFIAALVAVLCAVTAEVSVGPAALDVALRASLPWLLALLPVGGALGALGGSLARGDAVRAPRPRAAFLAVAIAGAALLFESLPAAVALRPQGISELAGSAALGPVEPTPAPPPDAPPKSSAPAPDERTTDAPEPAPDLSELLEEDGGEGGAAAPGYAVVSDGIGALSLEVPLGWDHVTGGASEIGRDWSEFGGEHLESSITASPDIETWHAVGGVAGVYAVASKNLARAYTDDQLVASGPFDFSSSCEPGARSDYRRAPYSGRMQA